VCQTSRLWFILGALEQMLYSILHTICGQLLLP
jgi:hypothetical protein